MFLHRVCSALSAVMPAALLAPACSSAQELADSDMHEVQSFVLTEAGLAQYTQATQNLGPLAKQLLNDCDDRDTGHSLGEQVGGVNAILGAQADVKSAGITARQYIVFTWSIFQSGMAAWALDQPGGKLPPGVSKDQRRFLQAARSGNPEA